MIPHRSSTCRGRGAMLLALCAANAFGQLQVVEQLALEGTVETVAGEVVTVRDAGGVRHQIRVPLPGKDHVSLADGTALATTCAVTVGGELEAAKIARGQVVRFRAEIDRSGKSRGEVAEVKVLDADTKPLGVVTDGGEPEKGPVGCTVTAGVQKADARLLMIELPPEAAFQRKARLQFALAKDAACSLESADVRRIEPGATVVRLDALRLETGDLVARTLVARNPAAGAAIARGDEALIRKYQKLSDEPRRTARQVRSRSGFFCFLSDVSDREWAIIDEKLERMASALEQFLGRKRSRVVEGFIVRDLAAFPAGSLEEDFGIEKIRRGEGVCVNSSLGTARRAVLYSCADHGVIQHECVHGFCHVTFGSTGPTWLAEGVAELGNYWRDGERAVEVPPGVMAFLQRAEPKRQLLEIAVPGRVDAGTWQDYAWRWALCHLLANNPNYSDRFRPLAVALMEEKPGVSFESVYGPVARQVSFEYDFFLRTVGNGYRSDLAAWPWRAAAKPLAAGSSRTVTVNARGGWQASGVRVERGRSYAVGSAGRWRTSPAASETSAAGNADGRGRLVAAILAETEGGFALGDEIPLGDAAALEARESGHLVLRCSDDWTQLGDNDGELKVKVTCDPSP